MTSRLHRKATIKDIARDTGVSTTTVINVLKGRDSEVSEATAVRVRRRAVELGYVRNLTAASLVGRRSYSIALISVNAYDPQTLTQESDINPFYGELILRFEREARQAGYTLSLYGGNEDDYVDFILQRNVDAAVLRGITRPELPELITRQGVRVFLMDCAVEGRDYTSVRTDDRRGGALAAQHLIDRGCQTVAFVGNTHQPPQTPPSLRLQGTESVCSSHQIKLLKVDCIATYEDGVRVAECIIEQGADGVVSAADNLAAGLLQGLLDRGIRVPEQVRVVGYDNLLIARMTRPMLTTIDPGLGEKVRRLLELVQGGRPGPGCVVTPQLIVRAST